MRHRQLLALDGLASRDVELDPEKIILASGAER